ncbi:MAG TPA: PAC2 family protein [Acidimicrobiales bacterium]|nr:PAC2 family protein [Acidimicrobiales bacterium]
MALFELSGGDELTEWHSFVVGIDPWIDAGHAAGSAIAELRGQFDMRLVAAWDSEALIDYRSRRPTMRIVDGVNTELRWPRIELLGGKDAKGTNFLLLVGPEPDMRWQEFCRSVAQLARDFGIEQAVGLGAFPAPVPHTRPTQVTSSANDKRLAGNVGFLPGDWEVPAGIMGAMEHAFAAVSIAAIGVWARVPHYWAQFPYPPAVVRLLDALVQMEGPEVDTRRWQQETVAINANIAELVAQEGLEVLIARLEEQYDLGLEQGQQVFDLPTGEEIAARVEEFLRDEGGNPAS